MALNVVQRIDEGVKIQNVLASVSDKTGLDRLIPALLKINPAVKIYSTGGTYTALRGILGANSSNLISVSDYTGQPEMQGGLVKTLDFKIYLGLLSETYNPAHVEDLKRTQGVALDMVIVNLYPFVQAVAKQGTTPEEARANIDIGGPCMVRASAKNFLRVASITDPKDYDVLIKELTAGKGSLSLKTRFGLAQKAFSHTAAYDAAIAAYLNGKDFEEIKACYQI